MAYGDPGPEPNGRMCGLQIGVPGWPAAIRHQHLNGRIRGQTNRGARIRTGDLCDPNAALYRTEPHPGTYSGN